MNSLSINTFPKNEGQIKYNFTGWTFALSPGVSFITIPPLPLSFSETVTRWPINIPVNQQNQNNLLEIDGTYGTRWQENEINTQAHWWRVEVTYTRQTASSTDAIYAAMVNPISGFGPSDTKVMGAGIATKRVVFNIKTYADKFSLRSQGLGSGYNFVMSADVAVNIEINSMTRESVEVSRIPKFI